MESKNDPETQEVGRKKIKIRTAVLQHRSGNNSRRLERIGWGAAAWQRGRETGETVRQRGCTGREREEGKRGPLLVGYSNGGVAAVQRCISCSSAAATGRERCKENRQRQQLGKEIKKAKIQEPPHQNFTRVGF